MSHRAAPPPTSAAPRRPGTEGRQEEEEEPAPLALPAGLLAVPRRSIGRAAPFPRAHWRSGTESPSARGGGSRAGTCGRGGPGAAGVRRRRGEQRTWRVKEEPGRPRREERSGGSWKLEEQSSVPEDCSSHRMCVSYIKRNRSRISWGPGMTSSGELEALWSEPGGSL
ncbi:uncharacterized protein LOC107312057 [Coturnix japonica]|uniref:uncharacterized protein LOC107312057 n=1 Tax=Coturnix japonica TaxID=93934 RepID=UPI0013A5BF65|nr:uncharacterized protein LOC107312057 [Coturnix japonica]